MMLTKMAVFPARDALIPTEYAVSIVFLTWFIVKYLYTSRAGCLFFSLKYFWVCQEKLADLKPKPWGKCMEKLLSISKNGSTFKFFFLPSFTEGGKFPKGCFSWLNAATSLIQNVIVFSVKHPPNQTHTSVLEKCPFVENIFL